MRKMIGLCMTLAALGAPMAQAAPQNCGPHADVVAFLSGKYSERRIMMGLTANGQVLELYAADSGTWTVVVSAPDGRACLIASGTDADVVPAERPNTDPGA